MVFCDFWSGFDPEQNALKKLLDRRWQVEVVESHPDLTFFSVFGFRHRMHFTKRICFSGEPYLPDLSAADLGVSSHTWRHPRHHRFPLWALYLAGREHELLEPPDPSVLASKTRFCAFVVGHDRAKLRTAFFQGLHGKKFVHSAGRWGNNIGAPLPPGPNAKTEFLASCRFNIAFENQAIPGYVTEKLVEAFLTHCIPIYWGAPDVARDFLTESFLHYRDFPTEEALIARILELESDEASRWELMSSPRLPNGELPADACPDRLLDAVEQVLDSTKRNICHLPPWNARWLRCSMRFRTMWHGYLTRQRNRREGNL